MSGLTDKQRELLLDKLDIWKRYSHEGNMEMRDYNRRAAEALEALFAEASPPASGAVEAGALDDALEALAQRAVNEGITRSSFAQSAEYFHDQASDQLSAAPTEGR